MNAIACIDEANGIGYQNSLLYHIKKDMAFFQEKTVNNVVVMGRKTLESFPNQAPLKNRINIVMTSKKSIDGCICVKDKKSLFEVLPHFSEKEIYVIGGQQIYAELLPYCGRAYITRVCMTKQADAFFPDIGHLKNWVMKSRSEDFFEDRIQYRFERYENTDVWKYR